MNHEIYSKIGKKFNSDLLYLLMCILAVLFVLWSFTGMWPWNSNAYNSYALQANSWIHGKLDLGQNYSHLELACYKGKYFVSFPPFPSVILVPFAFLFGTSTPDHLISLISISIGAIYTYQLLKETGKTNRSSFFWTLFLVIGTNVLFLSVNAWVWFFAQNLSFTLSMMAIYYGKKGKGVSSLFLWAASVGCRPFQAIYLPILLILLYQSLKEKDPDATMMNHIRKHLYWVIPPLVVAMGYMTLNYMRFDNPLEFGHNYLPEFLEASKGQFDLSYIASNVKSLFLLPTVAENGALQFPIFNGMSIFMISPIFVSYIIYLVYALLKPRIKIKSIQPLIIILVILHFLLLTAHKTMGGWQFGNRYTCDALPYLFYGLILLIPKNDKLEKYNYPLFFFGLTLNLVGTIAVYNNWI